MRVIIYVTFKTLCLEDPSTLFQEAYVYPEAITGEWRYTMTGPGERSVMISSTITQHGMSVCLQRYNETYVSVFHQYPRGGDEGSR